jgi:hypothetical protein
MITTKKSNHTLLLRNAGAGREHRGGREKKENNFSCSFCFLCVPCGEERFIFSVVLVVMVKIKKG